MNQNISKDTFKNMIQNKYQSKNSNSESKNLTIKYLINLLNNQTNIIIDKKQYLINSFPTLKMNSNITYDNILSAFMIACKDIPYNINENNLHISIEFDILKIEKYKIQKTIFESSIDSTKKKKYIGFLQSHTFDIQNQQQVIQTATNESILVLTYYFGVNVLLYNTESQIIKCFYYDNLLDRDLPFIVIKETKETNTPNSYYELVFSQIKYIFDINHPIIIELISNAFIVGLEQNKILEYLEVKKVSQILNLKSDNISKPNQDNKIIKLKMIPTYVIKILEEFQTMNLKLTLV